MTRVGGNGRMKPAIRQAERKDLEGLQTMRNLARNMSFLIRAIAAEKDRHGLPQVEHSAFTSFPDGK